MMKTSKLTGPQLDYWVAKADGRNARMGADRAYVSSPGGFDTCIADWAPSTDWAQGGPIKEKHLISTLFVGDCWIAGMKFSFRVAEDLSGHIDVVSGGKGLTELEAAMRCLVASKYGDEVPDTA